MNISIKEILSRIEDECRKEGGTITSRQIRAVATVLTDELNKLETRINDLEKFILPD